MSNAHTESLQDLMDQFNKLPGIGPRTAERLAYHILKQPTEQAMALAEAIRKVKNQIHYCRTCYNLTEQEECSICCNGSRDHSVICVVEQHKDLIALEQTGLCHWVYHVLLGHLAPLDGITPDDLTIDTLIGRVEKGDIREIVMATNPTMEGDGTALYISSLLEGAGVSLTRLARGLPSGGTIEYANKSVLSDAIKERGPMK